MVSPTIKLLSIVIPSYNEGKTIGQILEKINHVNLISKLEKEIIIIDDCSNDNTEEVVFNFKEQNPLLNIKSLSVNNIL
jgi:glycosyltransferase involved in cell wall biosynthesis